MIGLQSGEEKIGEVVGWSRDKIQKYIILRSRIVTEVLAFAKANQKGRVTINVTTGTTNERSVTSRSKIGAEILVFAKTFQRDLAPKNGAFAPKNERGVTLRSKIGTQILIFAKSFQSGRVPEFGTFVPKNERSVTTCDFTQELSGVIWKRFPDTFVSSVFRSLLTKE